MKRLTSLFVAAVSLALPAAADKPFYSPYDVKIALEGCLDLERSELMAGDPGAHAAQMYSKCERAVNNAVIAVDPYAMQDGSDFVIFEHLKAWEQTVDALQADITTVLTAQATDEDRQAMADDMLAERKAWDAWLTARCARDTLAAQAAYGEPVIDSACRIQQMAYRWRDETNKYDVDLEETEIGRRQLPSILRGTLTSSDDKAFSLATDDGKSYQLTLAKDLYPPFPMDTEFRVFATETEAGWQMVDWTNVPEDAP